MRTNTLPGHLSSVPAINLFGNVRLVVETELPVGRVSADLADLRDMALMPGTDDPRDMPPEGGPVLARLGLTGPFWSRGWGEDVEG